MTVQYSTSYYIVLLHSINSILTLRSVAFCPVASCLSGLLSCGLLSGGLLSRRLLSGTPKACDRSENICYIQCTCTCLCEYFYAQIRRQVKKKSVHIGYKNTTLLQYVFFCEPLNCVSFQGVCHTLYSNTSSCVKFQTSFGTNVRTWVLSSRLSLLSVSNVISNVLPIHVIITDKH